MENLQIGIYLILAFTLVITLVFILKRSTADKKHLANLALFPEQNPNPVIEVSLNGEVTYMNPAARNQFPELQMSGLEHELFSVISTKVDEFANGRLKKFECEITIGGKIYEQKVYAIPKSNLLRVYSSDITRQKEIENRLANLALFPEQNPNPVIELRLDGKVSYLNPAARNRFPDMQEKEIAHGLFDMIRPHINAFKNNELKTFVCETVIGEEIYEQKVYAIPESKILRVYSSDITERKRTEKLIRQKNEDITDSINYAKRIQRSMLPNDEEMKEMLKEHFVLYLPKDIVSGDFYWSTIGTSGNGELTERLALVAAVDCTGHGVPGALMSIVGTTLLNQTVHNPDINSPAEALGFLNRELPKNLKGRTAEDDIKDGMDMTMIAFSRNKMKLYFAGAMNPIYILSEGKLKVVKGDKQPISGSTAYEKKNFINHSFDLKKGDLIYLFTDGYADQFGGPKGKKFKYQQFQELLLANADRSMEDQKSILQSAIEKWRGKLEQVDDILVMGIRI